ncbi:archaeal flagellin N-terminal-like domain protein [Archaeoglobus fulgidus DSM 8774]|uniref:Archaeal flagellin N-terminal-like domain protein n=1 Tax=Archaeoglobus fulgidus DSM 8774 TaxID=1344584 RepID=A0A075WB86_ARCFL|nr:archaellin/type IV pilin N-terminal domain-containing protein [Archaeoglobus fulgidus]AIG97635.1 archaeal flagellin N-terminal-like domain protein [Archaeoglobus fulgidus DSM 8774]
MNNNGVSEVVGALLTVVVIVTAAGIIYVISHPVIANSIDNVNYQNAVKNMAEIKEIVQRMKYGSEVATSKVIQLNGGSMSNARFFNFTVFTTELPPELQGNPNPNINAIIHAAHDIEVDWYTHTLNIEIAGREIVFESGIFVKEYGSVNPIPISEPDIIVTNDTLYLSIYDFIGDYSAGGQKITINFKHNFTTIFSNVTSFELKSEFCDIWKKSFEKALNDVPSKPADFEDDDCIDNTIKIKKASGDISIIFTRVEVT